MKALILLFLPLATILAAGPGIPLEGKFKEMAQDGVGKIWAVSAQDESSVVSLDGRRWLPSKIKGLPDGARLLRLQALVDRDVGCLWSANSDQDQWIVTRHKGGDSWLWTKFSAKLREPQMLGCSDGSMLLTERGPTLIKIPKDGGTVTHITIDTGSLIEPKKQSDGEVSKDFAVFRAMEDSLHQLWIWNPAREKQLYYWRLQGLARFSLDGRLTGSFHVGKEDLPVSVVVPWDETSIALAVSGAGLFLLPCDSTSNAKGVSLKAVPSPRNKAFNFIETIFMVGSVRYVVTTPQPTETTVSVSDTLNGALRIHYNYHYDTSKPTDTLWRQDGEGWKQVLDGLDKNPGFSGHRPWVSTPQGLIIASDEFAPWFIPADEKLVPGRLADQLTFPLRSANFILKADASHVLIGSPYGDQSPLLWPSAAPAVHGRTSDSRVSLFKTKGQCLQDSKGRIWALLKEGRFVQWNGGGWLTKPFPKEAENIWAHGFVPDDRDQGWLLPMENVATAVFDFAGEKWTLFDTVQKALEAQLPRGVRLHVPEHPYFEHAFSKQGGISAFFANGTISLFDGSSWRDWKLKEIAGAEARLGGTPFFDAKGVFSVPVSEGPVWQWHGDKGWKLETGLEVPAPGTSPRYEEIEPRSSEDGELALGPEDRLGSTWWLDDKRNLHRSFLGRSALVLEASEADPFGSIGKPLRVLTDDSGNAVFGTSRFDDEHQSVLIRARYPVPEAEAALEESKGDMVRVRLSTNSGGGTWFSWRMDGSEWSALSSASEVKLGPLAVGDHRFEARAFNPDLQPGAKPAVLAFTIKIDPEVQMAAMLAALAAPELEGRERAARSLANLGPRALPRLQEARTKATEDLRWWLDAAIQQIERKRPPSGDAGSAVAK